MKLPNPCEKCLPLGGNWMETETGLKRCDCPRGLALRLSAIPAPPIEPVITESHATGCAEMMASIPFYPSESGTRAGIADELSCMCESAEAALWLVRRMKRLYQRWPGEAEMRLVYCGKYKPIDGIQATCDSLVYPNGIPSEADNMPHLALAAPRTALQIGPGEAISAAASLVSTVRGLIQSTSLDRKLAKLPPAKVPEIPARKLAESEKITESEVSRLLEERRNRLAAEELDGAA